MQNRIGFAQIKAVFFDLDGVLVNSYPAWYILFNDALQHFGFKPITEKTFRKHWGQSTEEDVRIFMPGRTAEEVRAYFQSHFIDYMTDIKIDPFAQSTLSALSRSNMALACLTNSHRDITRQILAVHKLAKYFKIIITADDAKRPKPAPDMLLDACRFFNLKPERTVFIGDTHSDELAGAAAGCIFIGYRFDSNIRINNLQDLLDILKV